MNGREGVGAWFCAPSIWPAPAKMPLPPQFWNSCPFREVRASPLPHPPAFDISKPVLYCPGGGLHGKLTVTAKLAPGCPAFPCGVRRHDAALELGDTSPRPSHRHAHPLPARGGDGSSPRSWMLWAGGRPPAPSKPNQGKNPSNRASSRLIKPHQGLSRHPPKKSFLWNFSHVWRLEFEVSSSHPLCDFATPRLCVKTSASSHDQAPIKAENPCNRASSSLIKANVKFSLTNPIPQPSPKRVGQFARLAVTPTTQTRLLFHETVYLCPRICPRGGVPAVRQRDARGRHLQTRRPLAG